MPRSWSASMAPPHHQTTQLTTTNIDGPAQDQTPQPGHHAASQ